MPVTQEKSTQITNLEASPPVGIPTTDWKGSLRVLRFDFTQGPDAGDPLSSADLVKLPAGNIRVLLHLSRINFSTFGASRTLEIGWQAYTKVDGSSEAGVGGGLASGVDVATAGSLTPIGTVGGDETMLFESRDGVTIRALVLGGAIPAGATIGGTFVYVQD